MSDAGHAATRAPSGSVLLTGATGFVGMEVLARYLERGDRDVVCLVRARDDGAANERLDSVLHNLFGRGADRYSGRVRALAGELSAPGLGLSAPAREQLAESVTTIVHSAASVSFAMPLDEARAVNVEGTRRMLEFAELARARGAGLTRYAQVSTAYVAGTFDGRFCEGDLDVGQDFHNSYEQSKFEAERLVREVGDDLPWMILRPSIVVGDSRSGWTAAFNVLYWPLRAFSAGLLKVLPSTPEAPLDVVSIDYVADAIHALCESAGPGGETFHLTAGTDAGTIGELAVQASKYFRREPPPVVSPEEFAAGAGGISEAALESSRVYFPYFSIRTVFDNALTRARLAPSGIQASPLHDYLPRLLDFATRSRWGKRPIARAEAQLP
jgi:thioester reductase-like protein